MSDVYPRTNRGTMFEQAGICVCNSSFGVSGFRAYQGLTALRPQTSLQKPGSPDHGKIQQSNALYAARQQRRDISLRNSIT